MVNGTKDVDLAYRKFKNKVSTYSISHKAKSRLYTEFKSTIMDRNYPKFKKAMLNEVCQMDCFVLYSYFKKKNNTISQTHKQAIYIALLSEIIRALEDDTEVVFDGFGIKDFEHSIISQINKFNTVEAIRAGDSQKESGLQFIDNICSVIRRHISFEDDDLFYELISDITKNLKI